MAKKNNSMLDLENNTIIIKAKDEDNNPYNIMLVCTEEFK